MLTLWAPYLRSDNQQTAKQATTYLPNNRVEHFWDLWRFGTRVYAEQLNYPETEAWDLFVGYGPGITWESTPPKPSFFFQHRDLDHGEPYSKEALEQALNKWAPQ